VQSNVREHTRSAKRRLHRHRFWQRVESRGDVRIVAWFRLRIGFRFWLGIGFEGWNPLTDGFFGGYWHRYTWLRLMPVVELLVACCDLFLARENQV
jgi:hypothetical protein